MTLREYLDNRSMTVRDFAKLLDGPTFQAISRYASGVDCPGLEVALMICRVTEGAILPHELLSSDKRKYTEEGDDICILNMADSQPEPEEIELF